MRFALQAVSVSRHSGLALYWCIISVLFTFTVSKISWTYRHYRPIFVRYIYTETLKHLTVEVSFIAHVFSIIAVDISDLRVLS